MFLLLTTKTWMFRRSPTCLVEEEKSGAKSFGGNVLAPLIDKLNWNSTEYGVRSTNTSPHVGEIFDGLYL